jgi:methylated-DNA-protein-cysteine methyltransferase-like protein
VFRPPIFFFPPLLIIWVLRIMDARAESPFARKAKEVIRSVPRGRVVTYGQVAALAGRPRAARAVAWILHSSSASAGLPWHRVINGRGGISLGRGRGFEEQRTRLVAEGVEVDRGGRVDLKRFLWEPMEGAAGRSTAARKFLRELTKRP